MKKLIALLLAVLMVAALFAGCGSSTAETAPKEETQKPTVQSPYTVATDDPMIYSEVMKVALVTDVGTIDDESFNQATWEGVQQYCEGAGLEYTYFQPSADSTDARVETIESAIGAGYNVIVMPGYLFGEALLTVQDNYPSANFIAIDVGAGDLTFDYETFHKPAPNTLCITFQEDQAGYLAGYAAVADGYTKLGFLGGMAVPAVIRYGYGFVQGANAAAEEMGIADQVSIKYTYGGQFSGDASITAKMDGWYADGTEVVFACGGSIYTSAAEAAHNHNGKIIGVDVDQAPIIDAKYGKGMTVTSAMKGLTTSVVTALTDLAEGNWDGGHVMNKSLQEGDFVGLPTNASSWGFKTFTVEQYKEIYNELKDGTRACSADIENAPEVSITVDYIQ
ncbi:MAG: BMP family ABC transporter substrate-binding protein [Oscillospiraceae bacterium]|nr:BMP family ABC transporter substrate-binding protein [Oscillospiraceae bacterium]